MTLRKEAPSQREELLSSISGRLASRESGVVRFRSEYLADGLVPEPQIMGWIFDQYERDLGPEKKGVRARDSSGKEIRLWFPVPGSEPVSFGGCPAIVAGVLEQAQWLSARLAFWYGWAEADATHFLLTGRAPVIRQGRVEIEGRLRLPFQRRLSLSVDPSASAQEVTRIYSQARQRMGYRRPLSVKTLEMVDFVLSSEGWENWSECHQSWNRLKEGTDDQVPGRPTFFEQVTKALDRLLGKYNYRQPPDRLPFLGRS